MAGSLVVSLPQSVLEPVGLKEGDRVILEAQPPRRLLITKEGINMTATAYVEMEIDLLEKKKRAIESDLTYKSYQHNNSMPCELGMSDNENAILIMYGLVRDKDQLEVEIAEKHLKLYEAQSGPNSVVAEETTPLLHNKIEQAWYHHIDSGQGYFIAFVNAKGSCSMRRFDAETGIAFKKGSNPKGDFQDNFTTYIKRGTPLQIANQPNLDEDCKKSLPSSILSELQQQIRRQE